MADFGALSIVSGRYEGDNSRKMYFLSVYILWLVKLLVRRPLDLPDRLLRL